MKPTIVLAADTYYPKADGVLRFMEEFIKKSRHDFSLHLLVPRFSTRQQPGVRTTLLDLSARSLFSYNSIQLSGKNRGKIQTAVRDADVVFIQELGPVGFLALRAARQYHQKTVLYIHNTPWEFIEKYFSLNRLSSFLARKFFVYWYNQADLLLIPYPQLKLQLRQAGVTTSIQVAQLGVDLARFSPAQDHRAFKKKMNFPTGPIIGYVGRVSNEKNTLMLLNAFQKLKTDAFLLIVGDGRKELIQQFKSTPNCRVTGFVSNVQEYLQAMDIFVMPSLTETTSLATLEAMATGLPVIVTPVGFMKNYVVNNHNGIFCSRNSPDTLAAKVEQLLANPALRSRLGKEARKTVVHSFSVEQSMNRIKSLLSRIHHSPRRSRDHKK